MSIPYMSPFQRQMDFGSAISAARTWLPNTGRFCVTARRGMPRIIWIPNLRPWAWIESARAWKPDGKRLGAGISRPYSSIANSALGRYPCGFASGSDHWISTTTYCHPCCFNLAAMYAALALTSASVTLVPYESQLFQPMGGVGAIGSAAEPASAPHRKRMPDLMMSTLPARCPLPRTALGRAHAPHTGEGKVEGHHVHVLRHGELEQAAARGRGGIGGQVEAVLPRGLLRVQGMYGRIAGIQQMLSVTRHQHRQMARRMTRRRNGAHSRHHLLVAADQLDLAQGSHTPAGNGLDRRLGLLGNAQVAEIDAGGGPEFPFALAEYVTGVREGRVAGAVDDVADVVRMRVRKDHGIDILRADPGPLQPRADRAGSARGLTGAGIDQDHLASGLADRL